MSYCDWEKKMLFKFQRDIEEADWDEYSSQGDAYLEIFFASVIILSVVLVAFFFFPYVL